MIHALKSNWSSKSRIRIYLCPKYAKMKIWLSNILVHKEIAIYIRLWEIELPNVNTLRDTSFQDYSFAAEEGYGNLQHDEVEEMQNVKNNSAPRTVICNIGTILIHENLENPLQGAELENIIDGNKPMSQHTMASDRYKCVKNMNTSQYG